LVSVSDNHHTTAQSFSPARGATPAIGVLRSAILETASARHWRWALHFFVAAPRVVTPSSNAAIEALLGSLAAVKKWALCFGFTKVIFKAIHFVEESYLDGSTTLAFEPGIFTKLKRQKGLLLQESATF